MSLAWTERVWRDATVGGSRLLVLLAIADYADESGAAWPSLTTLATRTRKDLRSVQRCLRELETANQLRTERHDGRTSRYHITVGGGDLARGDNLPGVAVEPSAPGKTAGGGVVIQPPVTVRERSKNRQTKETARRARLPDDFALTDDLRNYAVGKGCQNPERVFEAFVTHYRGNGKPQLDWFATFRTWVIGAHGGPAWKACGCGGAEKPKTVALAAGGIRMRTWEESRARMNTPGLVR